MRACLARNLRVRTAVDSERHFRCLVKPKGDVWERTPQAMWPLWLNAPQSLQAIQCGEFWKPSGSHDNSERAHGDGC